MREKERDGEEERGRETENNGMRRDIGRRFIDVTESALAFLDIHYLLIS